MNSEEYSRIKEARKKQFENKVNKILENIVTDIENNIQIGSHWSDISTYESLRRLVQDKEQYDKLESKQFMYPENGDTGKKPTFKKLAYKYTEEILLKIRQSAVRSGADIVVLHAKREDNRMRVHAAYYREKEDRTDKRQYVIDF